MSEEVEDIEDIDQSDVTTTKTAPIGARKISQVHPSDNTEEWKPSDVENSAIKDGSLIATPRFVQPTLKGSSISEDGSPSERVAPQLGVIGKATAIAGQPRRPVLTKFGTSSASMRQQKFIQRHGFSEAMKIRSDTARLKAELDRSGLMRRTRVFNPDKNKWLGRWDVLQSLALVYTATLTPFETCFVPPALGTASWTDPWYLMNRVLDLIFFIDMCLQFFVAYQVGNDYGGRTWVLNQRKVVTHYLRGWFALDASTLIVPCSFDLYLASSAFDQTPGAGTGADASGLEGRMSMLRVLRVLRLVKLVRLVRASRLLDRWKESIPPLTYAAQTVLRCLILLAITSHWFACIIALAAGLHVSADETWVGARLYGLCDREGGVRVPNPPLPSCPNLGVGSWYLAAISWAVLILTGSGGTDFYPSAASDAETLTVTGLVIIGSFIWTAVLAAFCDVATNSNPALTEFRQNLDSLNLFIAINELPIDMALRLRSFMHQQKGVQLQEDAKRALPRISPVLQVEVVLYIHRQWLGSIWFIRDLEAAVKVRLAMSMEPKVLAPGEVAPTRMLYVVQRGKVMFNGRILSRGMVWGDDIILQDSRYCLPCLARAIVYTDLTQLSQAKLSEIVSTYPASRTSLRRSTVRLAFRRHIVLKAREKSARLVKESQELGKDQPENLLRRPQGDFMDRVEDAASVKMSDNQEQSMTIALELNKHVSYRTASPDPHGDQGVSGVEDGNALKLEVLGALSDLRAHMDQQLGRVSAELAEMRKEFKTIKAI